MLVSYLFLIGLTLNSCSSDDNNQPCIQHFLDEFNMQPYDGQEITNQFFLTLHEYEGKQFALLGSHVADLLGQIPVDCDGNELCMELYSEDCNEVLQKAEMLGIIGISD